MQEEVNQPGPSLPTSGLRAGGGGQAGQNSWTRIGQQRFPGCDLAKEMSLGILWPFLGTLSWSLAQVLGKMSVLGRVKAVGKSCAHVSGFRGLGSAMACRRFSGQSVSLSRFEAGL